MSNLNKSRSIPATPAGSRPRDHLIESMHEIMDRQGGIEHDELEQLSVTYGLKVAEVFEVASSYARFAESEVGIRICNGPACQMAGSSDLIKKFMAPTTPCLGACNRAPAALVNGDRRVRFGLAGVEDIVSTPAFMAASPVRDIMAPELVLAALEDAALGGMGGARFPVVQKWRLVAAGAGQRHVIINADESEPGAFKDRHLLESCAEQVLTGALVASRVLGAQIIHVFLRSHHRDLLPDLIATAESLTPYWPDIQFAWRRSGGSYVCGEETALLECLEGRAGRPRHKPPFPAQAGLRGRPTLIHNVETFFWINEILARGAEWFTSHGVGSVRGLRHYSLSGRVRRPGVYVAPYGIPLWDLIERFGGGMAEGHKLAAFLPGGASGGMLPASMAHLALEDAVLAPQGVAVGTGAVIVLSQADDIAQVVRNLLGFFAQESCGQCAPCRLGTQASVGALDANAGADPEALADMLMDGSICGLGQGAGRLLASYNRHFKDANR